MTEEEHELSSTLLSRGVESCIGREVLEKRLHDGDVLRVKFGIDPTSKNIHLGRSIPLLKLRDFQKLGHQAVLIVGDFTGVIGDTSDKESERPMLSREVLEENQKTYLEQVGKIVDISRVEFHHNSTWLERLTYREIGEHADRFSVADFIARENVKKRLDAGKRVSLREVLYPLMQGYDSVAVRADVEIGGTDQRFNLLAGRSLQEQAGLVPQSVIMNPLILGLDGRKMSSSWGNTINVNDAPEDMYGKLMSLHDDLIVTYLELCTRFPEAEVSAVRAGLRAGTVHPRDAKATLAREVVTMYHSKECALRAEQEFLHTFREGGVPEDVQEVCGVPGAELAELLVREGVVASRSSLRRLVEAGAVVHVESGRVIHDMRICVEDSGVYRVGKRRFVRVICK